MNRLGPVLAAVVAISALAACSGGSEEPGDNAGSSSGATASETPTESDYLEVNDDVDLTEPGTTLDFGDPAVIAWEPRIDETAILRVTVDRVERTTFKQSFQGWVVTDQMKGQTPLFVQVKIANAGKDRLGGEQVPLTVVDDKGIHVQPTIAQEEVFKPCPGGTLPRKFKPDDKTAMCLLYLLNPGRTFTSVSFQPVDAELRPVADAISWTGEVTPLQEDGGGKGKKKGAAQQ